MVSDRFVITISFSPDTEVAPRSAFSPESLWLEQVMEAAFAKRGLELGVEVDGGEHLGDEVQFRVRLSGDQEDAHLARMMIRSGRPGVSRSVFSTEVRSK